MQVLRDWIEEFDFTKHVLEFAPTGSRFICDPPPMDTDQDFVAFTTNAETTRKGLEGEGYVTEGLPNFYTGNDRGKFISYRKGDVNLIVTPEEEFFDLFRSATALAKRFNLTKKADRIALFQVVLYGVGPHNLEVAS